MKGLFVGTLFLMVGGTAFAGTNTSTLPGYVSQAQCPASYVETLACRGGKLTSSQGRNLGQGTVVLCQNSNNEGISISKIGVHDTGFYAQKAIQIQRAVEKVEFQTLFSDGSKAATITTEGNGTIVINEGYYEGSYTLSECR